MSASSEKERTPQRQLGELMTELGLLSREQLATVLEVQQQSNRPLGQIIVELGFASGAAVAHALAMQSGGALRTEYGFALGQPPVDLEADVEETRTDLPKLRLAPTAIAPIMRPTDEPNEEGPGEGPAEPEDAEEQPETDAGALVTAAAETKDTPSAESEEVSEDIEPTTDTPLPFDGNPAELEPLRAEIERLESALAEAQAEHEEVVRRLREEQKHAAGEQERLLADVEGLEAALAETKNQHELNLGRLQEEHEHASTEIERLQIVVAESASEREQEVSALQEQCAQAADELERLQASLAEARGEAAEQARSLAEELERNAAERDDFADRLAASGPAVEERDKLRAELEQLESRLVAAQTDVESDRERLREELGRLRTALAEARAAKAEQERRLVEEQERQTGERDELLVKSERLGEELGEALERIAAAGPAAAERDELRTEVERLQHILAEVRESSSAELRGVVEDRDNLAAQLEEARELLRAAERVRESQIALEAERDRAVADVERLQAVATDAQAEAEERACLLAEEQDRHRAERETLLAQRAMLEQELGSSIEKLAAAAAAADERAAELQRSSRRLLETLSLAHRLAAEFASGSVEPADESAADAGQGEPESDAESTGLDPDAEPIDYSLFVPGPSGYELIPQTGVPPQAGQTVELVFSDREGPALFEVVRSGRTLPKGEVCVYLAQV